MPILSHATRKSSQGRLLVAAIYAVLLVGAVTMIYPFAMMISGSTKSAVDSADNVLLPRFLSDDLALYRKHSEGLFNESFEQLQILYQTSAYGFASLKTPVEINKKWVAEWRAFLAERELPNYCWTVGYISAEVTRGVMPKHLRGFKAHLEERYQGQVHLLNRDLQTNFDNWNALWLNGEDYLRRRNMPGAEPLQNLFMQFKETLPKEDRSYFSVEGFYKRLYLQNQYSRDIAVYNQEHGTDYAGWGDVFLDRRLPTGAGRTELERADWLLFVRTLINPLWIRADATATAAYQDFLRAKYITLERFNEQYATDYATFEDVPLIDEAPYGGLALTDWTAFLEGWKDPVDGKLHQLSGEAIRVQSTEFMFRDYLREKYGSLNALGEATGMRADNWMELLPPQQEAHYQAFQQQKTALRREFVTRNYVSVIDYIVLHGRAILNTLIYCALSVISALIVNPLAAYALSRYKPPSTYKVLMFLMLTMSFPPVVTQIPIFLMLRRFDMLNTFWALVLPGVANGYMIFLLKGFFDSLPRSLYESAQIDGAGEIRIFWQITMSLSKPILAVLALNAFTLAYSNFLMALLICQDSRMWTLMPWLYQLQSRSGPGIIYASLLIASVPTFLIFAICQNYILRGIVVPVEK